MTDRLNASKQPNAAADPKNPKAAVNNNKDLDVDAKKDEPSFFGSFFAPKTGAKKKGASVMEAPPAIIRPQAALNERETMETEVISCVLLHPASRFVTSQLPCYRTSHPLLFQHREARND